MLSSVEIRNAKNQSLDLSLWDPETGYPVKDIQGLDPVKAVIVTSSFATMDGVQYQTSRREARNIIFKLGMEPDYVASSVRQLRNGLYTFFMPKSQVAFRFVDESGEALSIEGRVESCDAPLFTQEPEATISIVCVNPDFYQATPYLIEAETVSNGDSLGFTYAGSVNTGFDFQMNIDRSIEGLMLYSSDNVVVQNMEINYDFLAGDILKVCTIPNQKKVMLTRDGLEESILYALTPQSPWATIEPGNNQIRVYVEGDPIPYTITYTAKFGGL